MRAVSCVFRCFPLRLLSCASQKTMTKKEREDFVINLAREGWLHRMDGRRETFGIGVSERGRTWNSHRPGRTLYLSSVTLRTRIVRGSNAPLPCSRAPTLTCFPIFAAPSPAPSSSSRHICSNWTASSLASSSSGSACCEELEGGHPTLPHPTRTMARLISVNASSARRLRGGRRGTRAEAERSCRA